jgi:mannose-6-phosphate isomerase
MNKLYPLKFKPIFKDKIWGGNKIQSIMNMDFSPLPNCGEAWVLSGVDENETEILNGWLTGNDLNEIVEIYMGDLVGEKIFLRFGNEFPILVKFIDANDWLSIQVHPDDELAAKRNEGMGKTVMWYILQADEGAELISGFKKKVDKEEYLQHLENKTLKSILNFEKAKSGDVFYIPAGRVHALGPGLLLAEIQQTSDTTYRIYDWDRIDVSGFSRELHTELAVEAIDYNVYKDYKTEYEDRVNETVKLVESPYFTTNIIHLKQAIKKDYSELDSFVIHLCVEGEFDLKYEDEVVTVKKGEALLLPAIFEKVEIYPLGEAKILEVYILM